MKRRLVSWLLGLLGRVLLLVGLALLAFSVSSYATAQGGRARSLIDLSLPGVDLGVDLHPAEVGRAGFIEVWAYPISYGDIVVLLRVPGVGPLEGAPSPAPVPTWEPVTPGWVEV